MTKDELDNLRALVAKGGRANADAPLRLAQALHHAGSTGEAIEVLRAAIADRVSDDASELDCVRLESEMTALLAELQRAGPEGISQREWAWNSPLGNLQRGVRIDGETLRWTYQSKPSDVVTLNDQTVSRFVACGPPGPEVPERVVHELVSLLHAGDRPWVAQYIYQLDRAREEAMARREGPAIGGDIAGGLAGDMIALGGIDPEVAAVQADAEARVILRDRTMLRALSQGAAWLQVNDSSWSRWLSHDPRLGWYEVLFRYPDAVFCYEDQLLCGAELSSAEEAEAAIFETLRVFPDKQAKPLESGAVARIHEILADADLALELLRLDEAWQHTASPGEQLETWTQAGWAWVELAHGHVVELRPRTEEAILGHLFCEIAWRRPPILIPLSAERRSAIAARSDRRLYPEMLRNAQLALAGGAPHSPWTISFAKGRFVKTSATYTVDIDEAMLVDLLMNGRFGSARFLAERES